MRLRLPPGWLPSPVGRSGSGRAVSSPDDPREMVRGWIITEGPLAFIEPETRDLYAELLRALESLGKFAEERKKTSVHLVRKSAFAGVHPRRKYLIGTVKAAEPIDSQRIFKTGQVSKSRWHCDLKLTTKSEIDAELLGWLAKAYDISGG